MRSVRRFTGLPASLDPDQPRLEYGNLGGRWHAMAGAEVVLLGLRSSPVTVGLTMSGFLELANFSDRDGMPWQAFRANFGLGLLLGSERLNSKLPADGRLQLSLAFNHESDHAADVDSYAYRYTHDWDAYTFPNGSISAYEYLRLRLAYLQPLPARLSLMLAVGGRLFTPPVADYGVRELEGSVLAEVRLAFAVRPDLQLWLGAFIEGLFNDFVAARCQTSYLGRSPARGCGYKGELDGDTLHYFFLELALSYDPSESVIIVPYLRFADAYGRGLDFPERRTELGGGLRFYF